MSKPSKTPGRAVLGQPPQSLTADHLRPEQVSRALRISIVEGAFATGSVTLTSGVFLIGLAIHLGASPFHIGLLAAIPALLTLLGLTAGGLVHRVGSRRKLVVWANVAGRSSFLMLIPFLVLNRQVGIGLLLVVVTLYSVAVAYASPTWSSWMGDLVPENRRGRFFGLRNAILGGVAVILVLIGSWGLDWFATRNADLGYGLIFLLAVVLGTVSTVVLSRQPEPRLLPRSIATLRVRMFGPLLEEPQFRRLILFLAIWFLTGAMIAPFFLVYMLTHLHFSFSALGLYAVIVGLVGITFQIFWGSFIDRFGAKPATVASFVVIGLMPLLWLIATPTFRLPIWIDGVLNGVFWTGANLGLLNMLFALGRKPAHKESYFAIFGVAIGLGAFFAAIAGGAIAEALSGVQVQFLGRTWGNYHILFLISGLARFACLPLLLRIEGWRSRKVVHTFQVLSSYTLNRLNYGKGLFVHTLRSRLRG